MGKIIVITGTPGAGKTTILNGAMKKLKGIKVINYGDFMFELAKQRGIVSRDEMRKQPLFVQKEIQQKAAEKISEKATGLTIVDTHSTINTPSGYFPGMPEWVIRALSPSVIVLIEAEPKEIARRRTKDKARPLRDREAIAQIQLQQDINRMAAFSNAVMCGASVKIIENKDRKLKEAVKELVQLVNSFID